MHWLDVIFSFVWDISDWFFSAYQYTKRWVWPFNEIAPVFLALYQIFYNLLTPIAHAHDWVVNATDKLAQILGIDAIIALLRQWLDWAEWCFEWIKDAWYSFNGWITDWWAVTQNTVRGWISAATQGFNDLVVAWGNFWNITWPQWTSSFNSLKAAWDDFWVNIYPDLVSFTWLTSWWNDRVTDVQNLITTAFTLRQSWWAGWQEMRAQIVEFFADPLEWLWTRFADWFLGPE